MSRVGAGLANGVGWPMKSFHHQAAFERAIVRLVIDRSPASIQAAGDTILFRAYGEDGSPLVVALSSSAWTSICEDHPRSAFDELEQLALSGGWEQLGKRQVWRVILI